MKQRLQGMVAGVLITLLLLSATIVYANTRVTREITYGIGVMLNGEMVQFDYASRPFVMDGRTFLPLRTLAELVGLPVDFDSATNTAIVGSRNAGPVRRPLSAVAPAFDRGTNCTGDWRPRASSENIASVEMSGATYSNVLVYRSGSLSVVWVPRPVTVFTLHNLNGQHRWLSGYVGRVDGTGQFNATMNIIGDGVLLQSFELDAMALPTYINVFVEDVRQLRIEFDFERGGGGQGSLPQAVYAFEGFLEYLFNKQYKKMPHNGTDITPNQCGAFCYFSVS